MMTQLRRELQAHFQSIACSRMPTLRRCRTADALLATNLPFIADADDVARFADACRQNGWTVTEHGGWLLLDHEVPLPDAPVPESLCGETGALISLLLRHPHDHAPHAAQLRALAKACEESPAVVRQLCTTMHADWAQRLRLHQELPGDLLPALCFAHTICEEERP